MITTLNNPTDIYNKHVSYDFNSVYDIISMEGKINKRLFATFTTLEELDDLVANVRTNYTIQYNKIFVLQIVDSDEYVLTYNVDSGNVDSIPENTILLHRKKESNTLYTINALNELIKKLNGGVVDTKFRVDWNHYRNCILLTQHNSLKQLNTKIYKIIQLD
jgi:hypothetical protein